MARNFCFQGTCNPKFTTSGRSIENQICLLEHAERDTKTKSDRNPPIWNVGKLYYEKLTVQVADLLPRADMGGRGQT